MILKLNRINPVNKKVFVCFFLSILFLFYLPFTYSQVIYKDTVQKVDLGPFISIMADIEDTLTFDEIQRSTSFIQSKSNVPNLGVTSSAYWVKFQVKNLTDYNLLLELAQSAIDKVVLYSVFEDGKVEKTEMGDSYYFDKRKYKYPSFIFELEVPKNTTSTFYVKMKSGQQIQVPLSLGHSIPMLKTLHDKDILFGIYCGVILVMVFYNLFIYFTLRDKIYLYYVVYTLFVGILQASLEGYTFQYLCPDSPWIMNQSVHLLSAISAILAMVFVKVFLQTKKNVPRLDKGLYIFISSYGFSMVLSLMGFFNESYLLVQMSGMFTAAYLLIIAITVLNQGYRPAKFFLIAWSTFLLGVCIYVLKDLEILPYNTFTNYMMQTGSALEVVFLSFALADRINILKKEKEQSQLQALGALQENDRIIREQNVVLEAKVDERTSALKKSNTDLNATLKNLKEAQSQLVNAEKMASLGQLTAGVAHEINNPINFVSSSIKPLRRDIGDILGILSKYEEVNESNVLEKVKEINDLKSALDLDYVKEEIDSLIKGIDEGASRTAEIVKGLKTFSRLDEMDLKRVDLNEGIDSTLILLSSLMMGKIQVVKEYGAIPKVECFAGRLNQVFMNLLNNAIHAVLKKGVNEGEGKITIKTMEKGDEVIISIADNGTGIPDKIRYKIFDPFFTTKDVGEGTGLGLSIVYNIIETHKGKIEVESEMGKGTEFIISLPKLQNS